MELVIYGGLALTPQKIEAAARSAAGPYGRDMALEVSVCRSEEELRIAVRQAAEREARQMERHIPFRTDQGVQFLKISEIRWLRGSDHRLTVMMEDGTQMRSRTRRTSTRDMVAPLLETGRFLRVSRAIFANVTHVRSVTAEGVFMDDGETLPISRKCYSEWMAESRAGGEGL